MILWETRQLASTDAARFRTPERTADCAARGCRHGNLNKSAFSAYQTSARGGVMKMRLAGERLILGGNAVTVLRGELL